MPRPMRGLALIIAGTLLLAGAFAFPVAAQQPQPQPPSASDTKPTAAAQPRLTQTSAATPVPKKPAVGPPALQPTHYPILLLVQGSDQNWSLRIGLKGPERLDRKGYPPIPLDPGDVVRDGTNDTWTYHAKDSQTGALVSVHISRTACSDPAIASAFPAAKFGFTASVDHAQVGPHDGCARVATDLFPKINNQPTDDDDDDPKDKTPPPTITKFKAPTAVAYVSSSGKMLVKRGTLTKSVPGKPGYSLSLSHDGKKLLFVRDEQPSPLRSINEYDSTTGQTKELLRENAYEPFWSPDDSQIAFLKNVDSKWQVWSMPADAPEKAVPFYPAEVGALYGWVDAHTVLVTDGMMQTLLWIGDDGSTKQSLLADDLYGKDQYSRSSANTIRVSPINPDLLLVSAEWLKPPQGVPVDAHMGGSMGFFTYEISTKRRVVLCPLDMFSQYAEWSRDGLQIVFTGWLAPGATPTTYKMFWDGTSQAKYVDGWGLVIGQ